MKKMLLLALNVLVVVTVMSEIAVACGCAAKQSANAGKIGKK